MTPEQHSGQFFDFFNLSGKATSFLGTFSFGAIVALTGSSRWAIFGLLPFFLVGTLLITKSSEARAREQRRASAMQG